MWNIDSINGLCLIDHVDWRTVCKKLTKYRKRYKPGGPFPNGMGFYPDFKFRIVKVS